MSDRRQEAHAYLDRLPGDQLSAVHDLLGQVRAEGVVLSGGQGALAGEIFRIGHLGQIDEADVDEILAALRVSLEGLRLVGAPRPLEAEDFDTQARRPSLIAKRSI